MFSSIFALSQLSTLMSQGTCNTSDKDKRTMPPLSLTALIGLKTRVTLDEWAYARGRLGLGPNCVREVRFSGKRVRVG